MKKWRIVFFLMLMFTNAYGAEQSQSTGNDLLQWCGAVVKFMNDPAKSDPFEAGMCLGMMEGVGGSLQTVAGFLPKDTWLCFPEGYTNGQGARVVVKYLSDHPKELHQPAAVLVINSFMDAFPCPWRGK